MDKNTSNAEKIINSQISGINRSVKLDIIIEGKIINYFKHFRLQQSVRGHHDFELILANDTLLNVQDYNLEEAQKFLGKRITVVFKYKDLGDNSPQRSFVGVITKVFFDQKQGSRGNIILKGKSPTILMDSALHTQSFGGSNSVNTGIIASQLIKEFLDSGKYDFRIKTQNKGYINYSAQYCETHYNYLTRLAESYGEQFYYDGEVLYFGELPNPEKPIELFYAENVDNIKVKLKTYFIKPEFYAYNSSSHTKFSGYTKGIRHLGELAQNVYEINQEIFKNKGLTYAPINPNTFLDVDFSQRSASGSAAVEIFTVTGTSTIPFLYPGCVTDLYMRKDNTNQNSYFTRLMIVEAWHEVDAKGHYKGRFEAIAEGTGFIPKPDFTVPAVGVQTATVISNTDPMEQGRVQVKFDWQLADCCTHFIRVMSPDAGGTGVVPQNRGFVAVPEVGDQVMVGFEYDHPDFPFVMGGMFHGKIAAGGGEGNHIKSIQTRSGNKIIFDDQQGSVFVADASGNSYLMDGKGNIEIKAPGNITFTAGSNVQFNVTGSMAVNAIQQITITVPTLQQVTTSLDMRTAKTTFVASESFKIESKDTNIAGTKKLLLHSDENAVVNSKGKLGLNGKQGNIQTNQPIAYKPAEEKKPEPKDAKPKIEPVKCKVAFKVKGTTADGKTELEITTSIEAGPISLETTVNTSVTPQAVKLQYDKKIFDVDKQQITPVSKGVHFAPLTVRCKEAFKGTKEIKAIAFFMNDKGQQETELAGKIIVSHENTHDPDSFRK